MGRKYKQLTIIDRCLLRIMLDKQYTKTKIAEILNVDRSTIYRELQRNSFRKSSRKTYYPVVLEFQCILKIHHKSTADMQNKL